MQRHGVANWNSVENEGSVSRASSSFLTETTHDSVYEEG